MILFADCFPWEQTYNQRISAVDMGGDVGVAIAIDTDREFNINDQCYYANLGVMRPEFLNEMFWHIMAGE